MDLRILTSTFNDGTMKTINGDRESARQNRLKFLEKNSIEPSRATLHTLSYDTENYCRYRVLTPADRGDGITHESTFVADAVVTTDPNHALLLPLADCIGAVIHDPNKNILMLSHLGRHNLEQFGGTKCVEFLVEKYGIDAHSLTVWLSPAAGKDSYPLFAFNNRSLHDVATEQLLKAGIVSENIAVSSIDVTTDTNYFSHSQFLKGNRDIDGRFCVVATMA